MGASSTLIHVMECFASTSNSIHKDAGGLFKRNWFVITTLVISERYLLSSVHSTVFGVICILYIHASIWAHWNYLNSNLSVDVYNSRSMTITYS